MLGWLVGCGETDGAAVGLLLGWTEGSAVVGRAVGQKVGIAVAEDELPVVNVVVAKVALVVLTSKSVALIRNGSV